MTDQVAQSFSTTVTEALAKNPKLKANVESIKQTAQYFDTWAGMAAYGGDDGSGFADFGWTTEEAPIVMRVAKSEAADENSGTGGVSVSVAASVSAEAAPPQISGNPYRTMIADGGTLGITASALAFKVNSAVLERITKLVPAFILLGASIDDIFTEDFFAKAAANNTGSLDAMQMAYDWARKARRGEWLDEDELQNLGSAMPDLFGSQWNEVMEVCGIVANARAAAGIMQGGQFSYDPQAIGRLKLSVPAVAEYFSQTATRGTLPLVAIRAADMIRSLFVVLRNPGFLKAVRYVPEGDSPDQVDAAMLQFLSEQLGDTVANTFRLSVAAENMVRLLAACPSPLNADFGDFLEVFGEQAEAYRLLYSKVGEAGNNAGATFRTQGAVAQSVTRRWTFRIDLKVDIKY